MCELKYMHVSLSFTADRKTFLSFNMSCAMRNPAFCISENKGADKQCSNRTADQRLCFCFVDKCGIFPLP